MAARLLSAADPGSWSADGVYGPRVVHTPDGWMMLVASGFRLDGRMTLGYALSPDGIHWTPSANNPVLQADSFPAGRGLFDFNLAYAAGTYFAFVEIGTGGTTSIYLATHHGSWPVESGPPAPIPAASATPTLPLAAPAAPGLAIPGVGSCTFPQTGQSVTGVFLDYWDQQGGAAAQGLPISGLFDESSPLDGKTYVAQSFEHTVFEYHPENAAPYTVLLAQLGTFRYHAKYPQGAPNQHASTDNPRVFPETGHTLGGLFRSYWETHGGLQQQGYPISDEFIEVSDEDHQPHTVQYFERAVFELHPANPAPSAVQLPALGTAWYRQQYGTAP